MQQWSGCLLGVRRKKLCSLRSLEVTTNEQGRAMDDLRANGYPEVLFKVSQSHYSFRNHT